MRRDVVRRCLGQGDLDDTEVQSHLSVCARCQEAVKEADEVRAWFGEAEPLDSAAHDAMRFRLEAAARTSVHPRPRRRRRSTLMLAAALTLSGAVAFALAPLRVEEQTDADTPRRLTPVEPSPPRTSVPASPAPPAETSPSPPPEAGPATPLAMAAAPRPDRKPVDEAFRSAWSALRAERPCVAGRRFGALLRRDDLGARRPDVLFWLAQSRLGCGDRASARRTLEGLLRDHGDFHRAADARTQLDALRAEP
ncbi:MAG: hypothetical protein AAF447_06955 [Myxococcota bacterium]